MKEKTKPQILVDSREPKTNIPLLEQYCSVAVTALPTADYFFPSKGIGIERKTITDYVQSLQSGHLQKQLLQMKQLPHSYLIIIGDFFGLKDKRWHENSYIGSLASMLVRYDTKLCIVPDEKSFCYLIYRIFDKTEDGKIIDIHDTELLRNNLTEKDLELKIITCFDDFGLKKAKKALVDEKKAKLVRQFIAEFGK